jgi:uncharacterized Fe-S cluster-containing radical SAM superfamily protein
MSDNCNLRCRHCWVTPRFSDGKPNPAAFVDFDAPHEAVARGLSSRKIVKEKWFEPAAPVVTGWK